MKKEIDGFGLLCPKPLILTKKAFEEADTTDMSVRVDNDVARDNILKYCKSKGVEASVEEIDGGYHVSFTKPEATQCEPMEFEEKEGLVIGFGTDTFGKGEEELGKILIKSFFYTLSETKPYPDAMVFYNSGINLTTTGSPVLEELKALAEAGVTIYSCGTCLDFYGKKEELQIGEISNMYTIYETLSLPGKTMVF